MLLAPALKAPPREVAERVGERAERRARRPLERVEVAGPGFLNLFLSDAWFRDALASGPGAGRRVRRGRRPAPEQRERILVEFVSANPTGPLNAAGGRHAAYGDSLARVLEFAGHDVEREYYVNDYGTQVELFGRSIAARMTGAPVPEDGYQGEYVGELAERLRGRGPRPGRRRRARAPRARADGRAGARRRSSASACGSTASSPSAPCTRATASTPALDAARGARARLHVTRAPRGCAPPSSATTRTACCAARPASSPTSRPTSPTTRTSATRGYDRMINVLGADHHGYLGRMEALFAALGDAGRLELIIMQLVHFVERGERAKMSKRRGDFVTLDELLDDIGVDAARFFMLERSHDTTLDLDLDLARERSQENPVYYVQYAHARIAGILRNAGEERVARARAADLGAGRAPLEPAERALVKRLLELPGEVRRDGRAPRAAPPDHLCARRGVRLPRLLPRLPRGGRRAGRARGLPPGAVRRDAPRDRARARPGRASKRPRACERGRRPRHARPPPAPARVASPRGRSSCCTAAASTSPICSRCSTRSTRTRAWSAATPRGPLTLPPGRLPLVHRGAGRVPAPRDVHGELRAADRVARRVRRETGVPWERTVIGGFSQGAVMAYALALGQGSPVAGRPAGDERLHPRGRGVRARPRAARPADRDHARHARPDHRRRVRARGAPAAGGGRQPAAVPRVARSATASTPAVLPDLREWLRAAVDLPPD